MSNLEPHFKDLSDRELLVLIADMVSGHSRRLDHLERWDWAMAVFMAFIAGLDYKQIGSALSLIIGLFK